MTSIIDEIVRVVAYAVAISIVPFAAVVGEEVGVGAVLVVTVPVTVGVVPLGRVVDEGVIALLIGIPVAVRIAPTKRIVGVLVTVGSVWIVAVAVVITVNPLRSIAWRPVAVIAHTIAIGVFPFTGIVGEGIGVVAVSVVTVPVTVGVVPLGRVVDEGVIVLLVAVAVAVSVGPS